MKLFTYQHIFFQKIFFFSIAGVVPPSLYGPPHSKLQLDSELRVLPLQAFYPIRGVVQTSLPRIRSDFPPQTHSPPAPPERSRRSL